MIKPFFAFLISFITYTLVDIHIWQRIFESNEAWSFADQYHFGWKIMFWGTFFLVNFLLFPDLRACLLFSVTFVITSNNGTEDLFYYWLDGRSVPAYLHWLEDSTWITFHPTTNTNLYINFIIHTILLILYWCLLSKVKYDHPSRPTH